ncbi:MAG: hypothetical protein HFF06_01800 [Oscillospiraceae bacterium]|jgi:hypothetical protein|nr:hypothetical protein [Oscillospiraceae bacterium]
MDIEELMKKTYGNFMANTLLCMEPDVYKEMVSRFQDTYDRRETFEPMFPWEDLSPEGFAATLAKQMDMEIKKALVDLWLKCYSREEIQTLCDLLYKYPLDYNPEISPIKGLTVSIADILHRWNKLHPDDKPVYMPPPDYI